MSEAPTQKRKKGVRHEENYRRNQIKKAKVHGESHYNHRGRYVPAKNSENINRHCCHKKCLENVTPSEALEDVLVSFYSMTSKNEQDVHLQRLMEIKSIQRRRGRSPTLITKRKPKCKFVEYFLLVNRQRIKVCKKAFMNAHKITVKRVRRIANLLESDITPCDLRGRHPCGNAIATEICQQIHDHIASFPTKECHYTSHHRLYLSSELSVMKMFKLFLQKHPELESKVNYQFYWSYFRTNFSLSFGRPAVDTCSNCETLKAKLKDKTLCDSAKRTYTAELMVHQNRSKKFYKEIHNSTALAKVNNNILAISFDYMAVIDLPRIPVQDIYYFRQLSVNTFGIYNLANDQVVTYVYHEGIARKTPDDVCSFLFHYLNNFAKKEYDELHLFCDNCAGQNKNHAMIRFLMALVENNMFKRIKLIYPFRGHSFLPCDRSFGLIKRKLRRTDRVYTVDQYIHDIILNCCEIEDKFTVFGVDSSIILNFQEWYPKYYFKTKLSLSSEQGCLKEKFQISKYHEFQFDWSEKDVVTTSDYINGIVKHKFKLRKTNVNENVAFPDQSMYSGVVPIKNSKMIDLRKLEQYIPEEFLEFWTNIFSWSTDN